jgi:hypothetical protein
MQGAPQERDQQLPIDIPRDRIAEFGQKYAIGKISVFRFCAKVQF